ncbi:hypothetical protein CO657_13635 [Rhizobium acidisoli]|uniref:Uncharacterized protein n=1 Tax=Rhizobium acidisoli TaxID=1538158 RepID=A0AAE5TWA3_9HYPH|nr:hypothetical protein [Rhizobium acidisoli]KPH08845.1 hypothetical protein AOG23_10015 [Rhizobium acidisoli]QAS79044.1 hypothetical protein CO657_13635 [Rhizobium acidisoli]
MSIQNCLARLVQANRISQKAADDALALHEGIQGRLYPSMGPASADAAGALEAARVMMQAAQERKLMAAKMAIRQSEIRQRMELHSKGKVSGLFSALTRDIWDDPNLPDRINVESHGEAITKELMKRAYGLVEAYGSKHAGLSQDTVSVWNVVDELYGVDTGDDVAKAAAKGWQDAVTYAVDRIKREGKPLSVKDDWRLPQFWDTARVRQFSQAEFTNDLMAEYQAGNMRVLDTAGNGEAPVAAVPGIIANAHRDISLGMGQGAGGGFASQLRVFNFENPDTYKRLMQKYGAGSGGLHKMLVGHLSSMSREIAFTEVFGPNYDATFKKLLVEAREDDIARRINETKGQKVKNIVVRPINSPAALDRAYRYMTGQLGIVESDTMAGFFGALRNIQTGARLGSAIVSAIPGDSVTAALASNANGIPAVAVLARAARDLVGDKESEAIARQLNLTAHAVMDSALGAKRFEDDILGPNITGRIAETVIRAQGLQAWTEGLKRAFSMEFMGLAARQAEHQFDALDPTFRGFLQRYGFTPAQWDSLRSTPQLEHDGARFFDVSAVEDRRLGDRLMSAILDERQFAVIEPNARIKAITTGGLPRGTLWGELARSTMMFKSFSMSIMATHMLRAATQGTVGQRATRLGGFVLLSTIAGAVTAQMQTIIAGKDPQPMDTPQFWGQALIRGGGLGMYGDLVYSGRTRGGEGLGELFGGPVLGGLVSGAGFVLGGEKVTGKNLAQYVKGWTPGSTLWYARTAADRLIFDQIQTLVDPNYRASFARYERRITKEFGQSFWWAPGDGLPKRAPDFGNAATKR